MPRGNRQIALAEHCRDPERVEALAAQLLLNKGKVRLGRREYMRRFMENKRSLTKAEQG